MFKLNSFCIEYYDSYKIVWNFKKHIEDKERIYLCGNCIRYYKYINGRKFKSQFQNIISLRWCSLKPSKLKLPFYEFFLTSKNSKVY